MASYTKVLGQMVRKGGKMTMGSKHSNRQPARAGLDRFKRHPECQAFTR